MSTNKKKFTLNRVSVDLGCSSCKRPRLSTIFHPKPKLPTAQRHNYFNPNNYFSSSSSSSSYNTYSYTSSSKTTINQSPNTNTPPHVLEDYSSSFSGGTVRGFGRVGGESVAVEKESDDPYLDFRHSMLQMILEKNIYSKEDLRELLNCFLQLNSPCYHGAIVRAFTEIWNRVFSVRSSTNNNNNNISGYHFGFNSRDF